MKRKLLFWLVALVVLVAAYVMPRMVESTIPTVYYVTPNRTTYESVVNCQGTILSEHVKEIYLQAPIVASEICVDVGDFVSAQQVLLYVNQEKTKELSAAADLLRDLSTGILPAQASQSSRIDWASLASLYGLSAIAGSGLDYGGALSGLLSESGLLTNAQTESSTSVSDAASGYVAAPMAGVVTAVNIKPDVPAYTGQSIISIADHENYKVMAAVSEGDIARIKLGDQAKVRGVGFSGIHYTGYVTKIYPTARKALSGTTTETVVDVEISLENADSALKPGFSAKVEITGGNQYDLITVPYESIKQDSNNDEYVFVYVDGKIKKQIVTTGRELTNEVEILDGISADSVVLYNPDESVREGAMIHIKGRADAA